MRELLLSIKDLVKGILRRFLLWVPFLLLDSSDYWERYLHPWLLQITGKNFMIPDGALLALMILGVAWAGILTFHELHERKAALDKKLEPTVEFSETAIIQQWTDQFTQKPCRAFYIAVKNSSATPLRGVSVLLTNIVPGVPNLDWLPIPLHIKHDNAVPNREVFNMNPMGLRHIDLVSHMETTSTFTVEHTVNGTNKDIPVGVYIFTVRVEGQNVTSPSEAKFLVRLDPAGKLVCLSAKYVDLDKGLFELRRDTKIGLENYLTPAIQKMTDVTDEISALMTSLTEELTEAQSKPIAIHEKVFFRTNSIADRLLRLSRGWALRLRVVSSKLDNSAEEYAFGANEYISNVLGYVDLASSIPADEVNQTRVFLQTLETAVGQIRSFKTSVVTLHRMRMLTEVTRSLGMLVETLDAIVNNTEYLRDGVQSVLTIMAGKTNHD